MYKIEGRSQSSSGEKWLSLGISAFCLLFTCPLLTIDDSFDAAAAAAAL